MKTLFRMLTTNLLVLVVCFSLAMPAQAATMEDVVNALQSLQADLAAYQIVKVELY